MKMKEIVPRERVPAPSPDPPMYDIDMFHKNDIFCKFALIAVTVEREMMSLCSVCNVIVSVLTVYF